MIFSQCLNPLLFVYTFCLYHLHIFTCALPFNRFTKNQKTFNYEQQQNAISIATPDEYQCIEICLLILLLYFFGTGKVVQSLLSIIFLPSKLGDLMEAPHYCCAFSHHIIIIILDDWGEQWTTAQAHVVINRPLITCYCSIVVLRNLIKSPFNSDDWPHPHQHKIIMLSRGQ